MPVLPARRIPRPVNLIVAFGLSASAAVVAQDFPPELYLSSIATGDGSTGFVVQGVNAGDHAGSSVRGIGDVNGDGIDDFLVGAVYPDPNGRDDAGENYVVFGRDRASGGFPAQVDLASLATGDGSAGFVLQGANALDYSGDEPRIASGDVNGDGIDDLVVGGASGDPGGREDAGATYVVYGRDTTAQPFPATLDLAAIGNAGFVLNGANAFDRSGAAVSTGDFNGDGTDDLVIFGSPGTQDEGLSFVVYGRTDAMGGFPSALELSSLVGGDGSAGFIIHGITRGDGAGLLSSRTAGDLNGDGIDDLIIGAPYAEPGDPDGSDPNDLFNVGEYYVIFGRDSESFPADFELASLANGDGSMGFVLTGIDSAEGESATMALVHDINGDGVDDFAIGARNTDPGGRSNAGRTYIVFGQDAAAGAFPAQFPLATLASGDGSLGFVLNGADPGEAAGDSVGAGDLNGDGAHDLLIGAPGDSTGKAYVVFGRNAGGFPAEFELDTLSSGDGSTGFVAVGIDQGDDAGDSVGAADVNGDGIDDWLVGASSADPLGRNNAGKAYIVYGRAGDGGSGNGSIGDFIWHDANGDGIQNDPEVVIPDVSVTLRVCNGPAIATKLADSDGYYKFGGLAPGKYQVEVALPEGFVFSPKGAGSNPNKNSDVRPESGRTWCTSISDAGEQRSTLDAGLVWVGTPGGGGTVGDYVWRDSNGDGVQDDTESGWVGITVSLRECNGPVIAAMSTVSGGYYAFEGLTPGSYQVEVNRPAGATFSPKAAGNDPSRNSDIRPATGMSWCVPISTAGEQRTTIDAGLVPSDRPPGSSLGDYVWHDLNQDGMQDDAEPGLDRVKVKLRNCNGVYQQTTFTDQDGRYSFAGLEPGQYLVHFIAPDGKVASPAGVGSAGRDSDADANGYSHCVTLGTDHRRHGIDAGFY